MGCTTVSPRTLLVAEALAIVSSQVLTKGRLRGILLPDGSTQQVLTHFADDATYSLFGAERFLHAASDLLLDFGLATNLKINRGKCGF